MSQNGFLGNDDIATADAVLALERAIFDMNSEGDIDENRGQYTVDDDGYGESTKIPVDIEQYELDFLNQSLSEERDENARLRATIKAKDFEINALRMVIAGQRDISKEDVFNVDSRRDKRSPEARKTTANAEDMLRVQEQIETVLKEEIVHLKRVVRIQKAMLDKVRGKLLKRSQSPIKSIHDTSRPQSPTRSVNDASYNLTLETETTRPRSRSRSRSRSCPRSMSGEIKEHYQYPTVASILHRGARKQGSEKNPMQVVEEEAMRILEELNIPLPQPPLLNVRRSSPKRVFR